MESTKSTEHMHPIENMGYLIISLFLAATAIIIGILNLYYYNKLRLNVNNIISSNTATGMIIASIVLIIIGGIVLGWGLLRLFHPHNSPTKPVDKEYNTYIHSESSTTV